MNAVFPFAKTQMSSKEATLKCVFCDLSQPGQRHGLMLCDSASSGGCSEHSVRLNRRMTYIPGVDAGGATGSGSYDLCADLCGP